MLQLSQPPHGHHTADASQPSPISRLRGWIEVHVDARIARSLCDFREGELARAVAAARDGNDLQGARFEALVTSMADAQARLLAAVEEVSRDLARGNAAAAVHQESAAQEELLTNLQKLVQSVDELQQNLAKRDSERDLLLTSRLQLHDAVLADLQRRQHYDGLQRETVLSSAELLYTELRKQRVDLTNLQQEFSSLQHWSRHLHKDMREGGWLRNTRPNTEVVNENSALASVQAQVDELADQLQQFQRQQLEVSDDQELSEAWQELRSAVAEVPQSWDRQYERGQQELLGWLQSSQERFAQDLRVQLQSQLNLQQRTSARKLAESLAARVSEVEERFRRHFTELAGAHSELRTLVTSSDGGGHMITQDLWSTADRPHSEHVGNRDLTSAAGKRSSQHDSSLFVDDEEDVETEAIWNNVSALVEPCGDTSETFVLGWEQEAASDGHEGVDTNGACSHVSSDASCG